MSYSKFDDPTKRVSQKDGDIYEAIKNESVRKALEAVGNRVLGGTSGTGQVPVLAGCGTGTNGVQVTNNVAAVINGRLGTITAQVILELPVGTQGAATFVKYLVSSGFGSSGTVTAGNEGTDSTTARLPNLPAGHVALGYFQYNANGTNGWKRTRSHPRTKLSGDADAVGTNGTVGDWEDLVSTPFTDTLLS